MGRSTGTSTAAERDAAPKKVNEGALRHLNLLFVLNSLNTPLTTSQIIGDSDLGYGSKNPDSDKRKFKRDRDELAKMGIVIRDVRGGESSNNEDGLWVIDRENTFADGAFLSTDEAEALLRLVNLELRIPGSPLLTPCRRIRSKLCELTGLSEDEAETPQPTATEEAIWTAFSLQRSLRIVYRNYRGEERERTCCIYGVLINDGIGYFIAHDVDTQTVKTFRIDRVAACKKLGSTYEIPADFCADSYTFLPFDFEDGSKTALTFSIAGDIPKAEIEHLTLNKGVLERTADNGDEWLWTVETADIPGAARFALGCSQVHMSPRSPQALVDAWNAEIDKAVLAHAN